MKASPSMPHRVSESGRSSLRLGGGIASAVAILLAACASSGPAVHLYSLMPAEPPARVAMAGTAIPLALDLHLPAQVEQPQLLVRLPDDSLMSLEQERWAGPLRDEMRGALFEELGAKFGIVESRAGGSIAPVRVSLDIRRFDSVPGREARIEGAWIATAPTPVGTAPKQAPMRCDWLYRESAGGGVSALPEAHRRAVVRLADAIGTAVVAASRGAPVACPASDSR